MSCCNLLAIVLAAIAGGEISTELFGMLGKRGGIIQGVCPMHNWKGEKPVDLLTVFIILSLTLGKARIQPCWFCLTWKQIAWITILFECSLAPSVLEWYAVNILILMPVSLWRWVQNFDKNSLSLSEMISKGKPFSQYHLSKNRSANFSAERLIVEGVFWILEFRRSVNVIMESYPLSEGSGPMKLIVTESPCCSGISKGWSGPKGLLVCDLLCWCYKLFFFFHMCLPCSSLLFSIYNWHAFTLRQTCLLHMFTSLLHYVLHVFTSRLTHFFAYLNQ